MVLDLIGSCVSLTTGLREFLLIWINKTLEQRLLRRTDVATLIIRIALRLRVNVYRTCWSSNLHRTKASVCIRFSMAVFFLVFLCTFSRNLFSGFGWNFACMFNECIQKTYFRIFLNFELLKNLWPKMCFFNFLFFKNSKKILANKNSYF